MGRKIYVPSDYVSGEYAVGTTCFSVVDDGRAEVFGSESGDRKVAVRVYYPVVKSDVVGMDRAPVFTERKKASISKAFRVKIKDAFIHADYYYDAPIATDRKFPLIMFSMGYRSYIESNTYLLCYLVSHGYIIASVGHAYEATENEYEDGSFDEFDKAINKMMYSNLLNGIRRQNKMNKAKVDAQGALEIFEKFQNECMPYFKTRLPQWAADAKCALAQVKERFGSCIDYSHGIGASGHSFGGCLAYYLCRNEEEFTCGINIDGGVFGEYPDEPMTKPFCQISCKANINCETRPLLNTTADTYHVVFNEVNHIGFTDAKFFMPRKMLTGKMDSAEMFRHLVYCHKAFFDKYLKGENVEFAGMASDSVIYRKV